MGQPWPLFVLFLLIRQFTEFKLRSSAGFELGSMDRR